MSFFTSGPSRFPGPRQLQGSKPGLLDSTQAQRVLRSPQSTLWFAAFDPLVAAGRPQSRKRAYDRDPARPTRIVIEICSEVRTNKWRFVPRARRAPGVEDEGVWPRLVIICDEPFILSEDQWDIYKLDPAYDCFVPPEPQHPVITRKVMPQTSDHSSRASSTVELNRKRRLSTPPLDSEEHPSGLNKKFRTVVSLVTDEEGTDIEEATDSDEEVEVEEIVEESPRRKPSFSDRTKQRRKEREEWTKERREKLKAKTTAPPKFTRSKTPEIVDLTMEDSSPELSSYDGAPAPAPMKRKVFSSPDSPEDKSPQDRHFKPNKRARTVSPGATKAELEKKFAERARQRKAQMQERMNGLREHRENRLWEEAIAEARLPTPPSSQNDGGDGPHAPEASAEAPADDEEARRQAAIEESRRKLAELEKDRPIWEEQARKRAMQEQMEQEARRLRAEEERLRRAEAAAQEEQRRRRAEAAAAEAERREQAEKARAERDRAQRRRKERERWSFGPWTIARALERYRTLSEEFDAAKFSAENPVEFETIPWPVLHSPVTLQLEEIEWSAVEAFFEAAKNRMRAQDYKTFVEKSHKRFHPDRWRARGVLKSVADDELRSCLEVASNTVAQALTPIWRETKN